MEKFNLKWNDFQVNVSKSFGLFRNEKYLQDITLVSEDFQTIQAHKLVLSACSEYFRNILQKTNTGAQAVLCLDGVKAVDLQNVLDYVYEGEVKIVQEDLDRFLNIAQKLKLQGLSHYQDKTTFEPNLSEEPEIKQEPEVSRTPGPRKSKTEDQPSVVTIQDQNGESMTEEEHRQYLNDNIRMNEDNTANCKICGKCFGGGLNNSAQRARLHVEKHIKGLGHNCSQCVKTFKSKSSLSMHVYHVHTKPNLHRQQ